MIAVGRSLLRVSLTRRDQSSGGGVRPCMMQAGPRQMGPGFKVIVGQEKGEWVSGRQGRGNSIVNGGSTDVQRGRRRYNKKAIGIHSGALTERAGCG